MEASLDRVRAQAMAMKHSDELVETARVVFEQLERLGIDPVLSAWEIYDDESASARSWLTFDEKAKHVFKAYATYEQFENDPLNAAHLQSWRDREEFFIWTLEGSVMEANLKFLASLKENAQLSGELPGLDKHAKVYAAAARFDKGYLTVGTDHALAPEELKILERMSKAFEMVYQRFEDLKLAEAQAHEAQIEASLERIRTHAMAMRESTDLLEIVVTMHAEYSRLGFEPGYFWHMKWTPSTYEKAMTSGDGSQVGMVMELPRGFHQNSDMNEWEWNEEPTGVFQFDADGAVDYVNRMIEQGKFLEVDPNAPSEEDIRHIGGITFVMARTTHGEIGYSLAGIADPTPDSLTVLARFAGAFDLAYKRFEDLQLAEAQTREAQIEAALERVRASAMAMHTSEELLNVVIELRHQMDSLNQLELCFIHLYEDDSDMVESMSASRIPDAPDEIFTCQFQFPRQGIKIIEEVMALYHSDQQDYMMVVDGEQNLEWRGVLKKYAPDVYDTFRAVLEAEGDKPVTAYWSLSDFTGGSMGLVTHQPPNDASLDLLRRAANVFDLAYRRFQDLKQAEAQTREAQIEAAMERIRARAMAMQSSDELADVSRLLNREVRDLGTKTWGCAFNIYGENDSTEWFGTEVGPMPTYPTPREKFFLEFYEKGQEGATLYIKPFEGDACKAHYDYMSTLPVLGDMLADIKAAGHEFPTSQIDHVAYFKYGYLLFITLEPAPEAHDVFRRFATVFEQTYTRFLDLQSAEEKTREAQIEAAMERIRARAMAMHSSEELLEVVTELRRQIDSLGQLDLEGSVIHLYTKGSDMFESIAAVRPPGESGEIVTANVHFPVDATDGIKTMIAKYESDESEYTIEFDKQMAEEWQEVMIKHAPPLADRRIDFVESTRTTDRSEFWNFADFSGGSLLLVTHSEATEETRDLLRRTANVFNLAYKRYVDLKHAESQAREAQIEAAMERIRSRAMAMHSSEELIEVAAELRRQMDTLGQEDLQACVIHLYEDGAERFQSLSATRAPGDTGDIITDEVLFPIKSHESLVEMMDLYASSKTDYSIVIDKEKGDRWQEVMMREAPAIAERLHDFLSQILPEDYHQYWNFSDFSGGSVLMVTHAPPTDEARDLLKRSAKVVDLAYRRFLDLKQAEEQAREAKIEASLERVRGRAMAMQEPENLGEVSILMFDELAELGVSTLRSGISLPLDKERYEFRAATKTEDGTTMLVVGNESIDVHPIIRRAYDGYVKQEEFQQAVLQGEDLVEYYHAVFDTMPLPDWKERMKKGAEAQEGFATFPFSDGWLYTFSREEMDQEQISIFVRFAKVFGLAYQRYHDLTKAAEDYQALLDEKAKTEKALTVLQATQAQLVEQEKLASLGSLTAGIAHEIKNPLNFVNNFAEVSAELTVELADAMAMGDQDEAKSILEDLQQNASQISKHGKRADSIVRSMMQHARGGTSERETIDVNQFLDEYVGLAWHGMRARAEGFRAEVEKSFDESVGSLSVQPQELGRVILNLLNNAFQAVSDDTEKPIVKVVTSRLNGNIEIVISDNGPGIPEDIREKIFEPFFTTKATGEGTGLGLSLSYDIVTKGHGGSMSVSESPEGGAEFKIMLPS